MQKFSFLEPVSDLEGGASLLCQSIYTTIKTKDVCMYVCHVYTGHFPIDESASYFRQS